MMTHGFTTLFKKEILRFWKVSFQTVAAPVLTALLYLLVFSHALAGRVEVYAGVGYTAFLIPGLVMMAMLQNAFANTSTHSGCTKGGKVNQSVTANTPAPTTKPRTTAANT